MSGQQRPKLLLLGGTSETAPLAEKLAAAGFSVLVSTATDAALNVGEHPAISRRCGRLDLERMSGLLKQEKMPALVDASHPYAREAQQTARQAAKVAGCRYLRYQRQETAESVSEWLYAEDHQQAAELACQPGQRVLLTTGSRHLAPYVAAAARTEVPLFARVLEHPETVAACDAAGLPERGRLYGRGPFSLEQNLELLRRYRITALVSKESGPAGGVAEKWQAAQQENCRFIVVRRPRLDDEHVFTDMDALVAGLRVQVAEIIESREQK